jgi:transposase-like protein
MGRLTYVCATCEEHFTRKTSATRHNLTIHGNRGEIVSLLEYLVGRSSRRYHASHPFWYRRRREKGMHRFGHATAVADSIGDTFRHLMLQHTLKADAP